MDANENRRALLALTDIQEKPPWYATPCFPNQRRLASISGSTIFDRRLLDLTVADALGIISVHVNQNGRRVPATTRRTIGCTGDLGAVDSELTPYSSVPVIRAVLPLKLRPETDGTNLHRNDRYQLLLQCSTGAGDGSSTKLDASLA